MRSCPLNASEACKIPTKDAEESDIPASPGIGGEACAGVGDRTTASEDVGVIDATAIGANCGEDGGQSRKNGGEDGKSVGADVCDNGNSVGANSVEIDGDKVQKKPIRRRTRRHKMKGHFGGDTEEQNHGKESYPPTVESQPPTVESQV